jgi:alanine racemase
MTVSAPVVQVRDLSAGEAVGYGATHRASAATRVATLRFGYADGFPWTAAGRAKVWLADALLPVVGRVSMDYIAVDVADADVSAGDEAVIFGPRRGVSVDELAAAGDTISYELLVRVGARVPRRWVS